MRPYISRRGAKYRARTVTTDTDGHERWITLASGCDTAAEAEEHGWAAISKIKKGVWIDPRQSEATLERWANSWLAAQELQLSSYQQYVYLLSSFVLPEYGDRALTSLTYADHEIAAWEARIRSAYSVSTAGQARGVLKRMLEDAAAQKLIERNPAERRGRRGSVEERRLQEKHTRKAEDEKWTSPLGALLVAERMALLSGRDDEFTLAITKAYTAMRMGELIGLERDRVTATTIDVRWQLYELNDSATIRKNPKDGSLRTIDAPPHVVLLLHHQIRKLGPYDPVHAALCPCVKHDGDAEFQRKYAHPRGAHVFRGTTSVRSRFGAAGVRLADVAGAAGVSTGTVSNVVNRPEKVSATVRRTVEAALEDFGLAHEMAASGGYAPHHRRDGFRTWLFTPAATGWYPEKKPSPARPVPIVPDGLTGKPARGRGAAQRALASWLPVCDGLTPHGLRHSHQTWMDEDEIPEKLKRQVMGHADEQTVQQTYGHVTPQMRARRIRALTERWEQSLRDRARIWPTSHVPLLDGLLEPYRHHHRRYLPVALPTMIIAQSLPTWYNEAHHPNRAMGL